jgi:hypothetical protein
MGMKKLSCCASIVVLVAASVAYTGETVGEAISLPKLDGSSAKGLEIECRLVKTKFVVGEPVNMWCTVRNTTDSIKPIGWHSNTGLHFCCVQGNNPRREGLLPRAYPQIRSPIMIKSKGMQPGYILFLPPRKSMQILLTHKPRRPVKFKGRIIYDPVAPRGGTVPMNEEGPPWKNEWVYSNEFEYEVIGAAKE